MRYQAESLISVPVSSHSDMFGGSSASQMAAAVAAAYPYTFYTAATSSLYDVGEFD